MHVALTYQRHLKTPLPRELWAYDETCLMPPMKEYVQLLKTKLTDTEKKQLDAATNKWPDYPVTIKKLGEAHQMGPPPWNTALSGPRERWDDLRAANRTAALAVPQQVLQDFAMLELEPARRLEINKLPWAARLKQLAAEYNRHQEEHGPWKGQHVESRDKSKGRRSSGHDKR